MPAANFNPQSYLTTTGNILKKKIPFHDGRAETTETSQGPKAESYKYLLTRPLRLWDTPVHT